MANLKGKNPQDVLKALLEVEDIPQKEVPMARFGINFVVQAIDGKMLNQIQEQCTFSRIGKGGKQIKQIDEQKMSALIIEKACVVPNWNDQQLKDKYGVFEAHEVIGKRLLSGEIAKLSEVVMDLSGFGDPEEQIEEAKN